MFKTAVLSILSLTAAGIGLTLYLPEYSNTTRSNLVSFVLAEETLRSPVPAKSYRLSNSLLTDTGTTHSYALLIGIYSSLDNAINSSKQLSVAAQQLPTTPTIFKASEQDREWYVLAVGPLNSQQNSQQHQFLLAQQQISAQPIIWPLSEAKPPQDS